MLRKIGFNLLGVFLVMLSIIPASPAAGQAGGAVIASQASAPAAPAAPTDTPTTLVASGVTQYTLASPKVFWYTGVPGCPPAGPTAPNTYPEDIQRIPSYGGLTRTLYHRDANCGTGDVLSNLISDGSFLYWISASQNGVVKLSTNANPGDAPQLVSNTVSGVGVLTQAGSTLYAVTTVATGSFWQIDLTNGAATQLVANAGAYPGGIITDGPYVYWVASGTLYQWDVHYAQLWGMTTNVAGVFPDMYGVYYGQGTQIRYYSNMDNTFSTIYTSPDASAVFTNIQEDASHLFAFEKRTLVCNPFCSSQYFLQRMDKNGANLATLYVSPSLFAAPFPGNLRMDGDYLFWQQGDAIYRLPKDASALPLVNLSVTGLEINQSVQKLDNSVRLIENKRTFVRVYVKSEGAPVAGVTAHLYQIDINGFPVAGPLIPVNPVGTTLTVYNNPSRNNLNDSFLFELPWGWLTGSLRLRAVLNPNGVPPQASYTNNTRDFGPFTFDKSPRLQMQFVSFGYILNNQYYYPRLVKDVIQAYSWIRRVYPLASTPGFANDSTPGFRPNLWTVVDDGLGPRVDQSDKSCAGLKDKSLCASAYTNSLLNQLRTDNNIADNIFMYGMISDGAGIFPRGQAGSGNVSSGPAGKTCCGSASWDTDGSYADWYAGHEIGHTLGRDHPFTGSSQDTGVCGQTPADGALDKNYPYPNSDIGPDDKTLEGLDTGDSSLGIPPNIYPGTTWKDNMSYCSNKWISDYTYNGMYDYMNSHPTNARLTVSPPGLRLAGDYLSVFGAIFPDTNSAAFHRLSHTGSVGSIPALTPGDYSIRLIGSGNATLANYPFTPTQIPDQNQTAFSFSQVVTFTTGTTEVQIVRLSDAKVLASRAVSANAPTVSAVTLNGVSNPVTGVFTLSWTGSDADGDPLTFDVLYSRDGGLTFQPVKTDVSGSSTEIDSARLGGSTTALFRVVANDGVNTGQGDSPTFSMADKPPVPMILTPGDNLHIHYGQLVNFSGIAEDFQDGSTSSGNLLWSNQYGTLGVGPLFSSTNLPVGVNHIALTATNSKNLTASAYLTVTVDDDLTLPGPTLTAGPNPVGWHVTAGTTTPQTAQVAIGNAGSGTLNWQASSAAAWLALDAVSGTAPYTLTLSADPSGLKNGETVSTTLLITSTNQAVPILVSLSMGDTWNAVQVQPQLNGMKAYLPAMYRH